MKKTLFWSLFLILPLTFFGVLYAVDHSFSVDPKYQVSSLDYLVSDLHTPPEDSAQWEPTVLPYEIDDSHGNTPSVWFRLQFNPDNFGLYDDYRNHPALLFLAPYANLAVYLNGFLVDQGGSMTPPIAYNRRALLFRIPQVLLEEGGNTLFIHMAKPRPGGNVKPFYLAPQSNLEPTYTNDTLLKLRLPQGIMVAMGLIVAIMALLFLFRRSETAYGWYVLTLLLWLLHHSHDLVVDIPIKNYSLWVGFSYISLGWFVVMGMFFVSRFLGYKRPRVEKVIVFLALLGSAIFLALATFWGFASIGFAQTVWVPAINILGFYIVVQLYRGVSSNPSLENKGLLLVVYLVSVAGVRDYFFEVYPQWIPGSVYYLQYSSGFVLVFFSLILMRRFAFALNEAETLNEDLELRIQQKTQELEHNFEKLQEVEKANTLATERERIMQDMHDGFGGQLVQVLSQVENTPTLAPIEDTIRDALQDLRLIIDSLAETQGSLVTVLGAFRHRINKPIEKSGLILSWNMTDIPDVPRLTPSMRLQVLRILQEAVTNVLKHANATHLSISTTAPADDLVNICIKDDGAGYSAEGVEAETAGHGIANMRHRATRIDATLSMLSDSSGTQIDLSIPVR